MNARIRRLIVEHGVSDVYLSMDGVYKQTLERIRVGSKYQRIVANILALRDLKQAARSERPTVILNFVMMDCNIHEAPKFVELASRLGASLIDFRHLIANDYMDDRGQYLSEHKAKYNFFRARIAKAAKRCGIEVSLPSAFNTSESFDPTGLPEVDLGEFEAVSPDRAQGDLPVPRKTPKITSLRGTSADTFSETFCEMPFSEIMIAGQDRVQPCPFYQGELGRLSEGKTLSEIFYGPAFQRLRQNMLRPHGDAGCRGCPIKAKRLTEDVAGFGSARGKLRRLLK